MLFVFIIIEWFGREGEHALEKLGIYWGSTKSSFLLFHWHLDFYYSLDKNRNSFTSNFKTNVSIHFTIGPIYNTNSFFVFLILSFAGGYTDAFLC